jgi:hypothetical protein
MPARIGSFTGPTFAYGQPLSVVHPPDNDFTTAQFFPELIGEGGMTEDERAELQREYEELLAAITIGRDFYATE